MYEPVRESIAVAGVYEQSQFTPKRFQWRGRAYEVEKVTLRSDVRDGNVHKRLYSLQAGGTLYRVEFNREDESWQLLEVWCE